MANVQKVVTDGNKKKLKKTTRNLIVILSVVVIAVAIPVLVLSLVKTGFTGDIHYDDIKSINVFDYGKSSVYTGDGSNDGINQYKELNGGKDYNALIAATKDARFSYMHAFLELQYKIGLSAETSDPDEDTDENENEISYSNIKDVKASESNGYLVEYSYKSVHTKTINGHDFVYDRILFFAKDTNGEVHNTDVYFYNQADVNDSFFYTFKCRGAANTTKLYEVIAGLFE